MVTEQTALSETWFIRKTEQDRLQPFAEPTVSVGSMLTSVRIEPNHDRHAAEIQMLAVRIYVKQNSPNFMGWILKMDPQSVSTKDGDVGTTDFGDGVIL